MTIQTPTQSFAQRFSGMDGKGPLLDGSLPRDTTQPLGTLTPGGGLANHCRGRCNRKTGAGAGFLWALQYARGWEPPVAALQDSCERKDQGTYPLDPATGDDTPQGWQVDFDRFISS